MRKFIIFTVAALIIVGLLCLYIDIVCASDYSVQYIESVISRDNMDPQEYMELVFKHIEENYPANCTLNYALEEFVEPIIGEPEIEYMPYTEEELDLLARLIFSEAGSDWCSDKMQQYVGSVVLNRIQSAYFPNNMYDVIYQRGQYSVVNNGAINKTPNERAYEVAKYLLINGSVLPSNVIFQSQFIQGDGIYEKVQNMYFCYKN